MPITVPTITTFAELDAWLREIGKNPMVQSLVSETLDEMVHEVKSRQAAEINNGGIDSQVGFLLDTDGGDVPGLVHDLRGVLESQ